MLRSLQTTVFRAPVTAIQFVTGTKRLSAPSIFFGDQKTTPLSQSRHRALLKFSPVFVSLSVQESGTNAEVFGSHNPEADLAYKKPTDYAPCVYQHMWFPVIISGEPSLEMSSVRGWCSPIHVHTTAPEFFYQHWIVHSCSSSHRNGLVPFRTFARLLLISIPNVCKRRLRDLDFQSCPFVIGLSKGNFKIQIPAVFQPRAQRRLGNHVTFLSPPLFAVIFTVLHLIGYSDNLQNS